ncbi:cytochrome c maturation protein CcmE [Desulfonatronovibrio hydrogenovorans]|uniref:cytochrome c maturation protein CcmE n=1 Tax=Desulfonatronovibrio hydrogenovorans TaxID=53245 RepID=UPI00068B71D1|nr:cytochrome c maturation protein CcmE [Desulfonatronovibrio hydrogenovorans]
MSGKKNSRLMYVVAFVLIFSGVGYLMATSIARNSTYFLEVSEALAMDTSSLERARLFGTVGGSGLERDQDALGVTFNLQDKEDQSKVIRVRYTGAIPDLFAPGAEVIVEGGMNPEQNMFMASTLMTKCASKYESQDSYGGEHPDQIPYQNGAY